METKVKFKLKERKKLNPKRQENGYETWIKEREKTILKIDEKMVIKQIQKKKKKPIYCLKKESNKK